MENERELVVLRVKRWKRKLTLAQTMLRKYEAKLKRLEKKQLAVAKVGPPSVASPEPIRRKFKLKA